VSTSDASLADLPCTLQHQARAWKGSCTPAIKQCTLPINRAEDVPRCIGLGVFTAMPFQLPQAVASDTPLTTQIVWLSSQSHNRYTQANLQADTSQQMIWGKFTQLKHSICLWQYTLYLSAASYRHTAGMLLVVWSAMTLQNLLHHSLKKTLHGMRPLTTELLQECYAAGSDVLHLQTCTHSSRVCLLWQELQACNNEFAVSD